MKEINGDLIKLAMNGYFDVIAHGCNCFCNMGAGLAREIKNQYPNAFLADKKTSKGNELKLGTISISEEVDVIVVNAYTQYKYGRNGNYLDYTALVGCMKEIKKRYSGKRIGLPLIGCGLAGGEWDKVKQIILDELKDEDVTIVRY